MSKNTVRIARPAGTFLYLTGSHTAYTGTGTPWDTESTTPFELSLNDVTQNIWSPQSPPMITTYRGGPPFGIGRRPVSRTYDNITETVGLQIRASSKDNAMTALQMLLRVLNASLNTLPARLQVQMGSQYASAEIYAADLTVAPNYVAESSDDSDPTLFRCTLTITRSLFGLNADGGGERLLNAVSFGNTGTGTPDNTESLGTMVGDLQSDVGQPMNVLFTATSGVPGPPYFVASVKGRTYTNTGQSLATSSTTGAQSGTMASHAMANYLTNLGITPRTLFRIDSPSSNLQVRAVVQDASGTTTIYTSPWLTPGSASVLLDMGAWSADAWRNLADGTETYTAIIKIGYRSTDGNATSGTLDYVETLDAYTFAVLTGGSSATGFRIVAFPDHRDGLVALPQPMAFAVSTTGASNELGTVMTVRGVLPRAFTGASLYLAWHDNSTGAHTTTRTALIDAYHAPLWIVAAGAES